MNSARRIRRRTVELSAKFIVDPTSIEAGFLQILKKEHLIRKSQLVVLVFGLMIRDCSRNLRWWDRANLCFHL